MAATLPPYQQLRGRPVTAPAAILHQEKRKCALKKNSTPSAIAEIQIAAFTPEDAEEHQKALSWCRHRVALIEAVELQILQEHEQLDLVRSEPPQREKIVSDEVYSRSQILGQMISDDHAIAGKLRQRKQQQALELRLHEERCRKEALLRRQRIRFMNGIEMIEINEKQERKRMLEVEQDEYCSFAEQYAYELPGTLGAEDTTPNLKAPTLGQDPSVECGYGNNEAETVDLETCYRIACERIHELMKQNEVLSLQNQDLLRQNDFLCEQLALSTKSESL